jgi:hypothetical protein
MVMRSEYETVGGGRKGIVPGPPLKAGPGPILTCLNAVELPQRKELLLFLAALLELAKLIGLLLLLQQILLLRTHRLKTPCGESGFG